MDSFIIAAYGDLATTLQHVTPIGTIAELECQAKWTASVIDYTRQVCVYDYGVETKRGPCYVSISNRETESVAD